MSVDLDELERDLAVGLSTADCRELAAMIAELRALRAERDGLRAEVEAMREVVDAAGYWQSAWTAAEEYSEQTDAEYQTSCDLDAALDAYRASRAGKEG